MRCTCHHCILLRTERVACDTHVWQSGAHEARSGMLLEATPPRLHIQQLMRPNQSREWGPGKKQYHYNPVTHANGLAHGHSDARRWDLGLAHTSLAM